MSIDRSFTRFAMFHNKVTDETIDILQGRAASFRNACHKLTQYVKYNFSKPYIYHLTLTVADNVPSIDMSHYNRTMTFIRTKAFLSCFQHSMISFTSHSFKRY